MAEKIKILGIAGSLRKKSYNRALLNEAAKLLPPDSTIEITGIEGIPVYNQDEEGNLPQAVVEFKRKIRDADAILFALPEYNYSLPGPLKNAIDYASRPYPDNSFAGKAAAMMSASIGILGGARAQYQLRQAFVFLNMVPVNLPEVFVTFAQQKFDSELKLTDNAAKQFISQLLVNLVKTARNIKRNEVPARNA